VSNKEVSSWKLEVRIKIRVYLCLSVANLGDGFSGKLRLCQNPLFRNLQKTKFLFFKGLFFRNPLNLDFWHSLGGKRLADSVGLGQIVSGVGYISLTNAKVFIELKLWNNYW